MYYEYSGRSKMNHFKENLKEYRLIYKYTQRRIAAVLGISQVQYCKYENGINEPSLDMLIRISNLFDISLDDLIL